jgi:hypothetical protein
MGRDQPRQVDRGEEEGVRLHPLGGRAGGVGRDDDAGLLPGLPGAGLGNNEVLQPLGAGDPDGPPPKLGGGFRRQGAPAPAHSPQEEGSHDHDCRAFSLHTSHN